MEKKVSAQKFNKLLEPYYIGKVKIRNRIIKTGAGTSFIGENGQIEDRIIGFYEALAEGGVGLVTVESTGVDYPAGTHHPSVQLHLENDSYVPGYKRLTEAVHNYNCPVFLQLFHSGPWHPQSWSGIQPIAASALLKDELPNPHLDAPRGVTKEEIKELVKKFSDAAERAYRAGFDGVEVNASSTHLINSFLSPGWNKRQDEYGPQTLENRSRFLVEIITAIKNRLGADFPVSVLLTGVEYGLPQGITLKDSCGFAKIIEKAGVNAIQVRGYGYRKFEFIHPGPEQLLYPEPVVSLPTELDWDKDGAGAFAPLSEAFKKVVSVPVIAVGRLDPELGESLLDQGKADFIAMNRRLLADPELPRKIAEGRIDDIAPCTACLYCWSRRRRNLTIKCRINSRLGRERELIVGPSQQVKKVLVIGSGPSGMEAARISALRGHSVSIVEKEKRAGGLLPLAAMVKGKKIEDVASVVTYFQRQLANLGVKIEMGKEADPSLILAYQPDVVILATGGKPNLPDIPGIQIKKVLQMAGLHKKLKFFLKIFNSAQLNRLSKIWMPVGKNVAIIGSDIQAVELAEFLVKRERNVSIIDKASSPGLNMVPEETRTSLLSWLERKGTQFFMNAEVKDITSEGVRFIAASGETMILKSDTIIPALPLNPDPVLFESLNNRIKEVYQVGDCLEPGLIPDAVGGGADIGYKL
jgi:2,4-dienoyl-CoA reductase (NADPH2)